MTLDNLSLKNFAFVFTNRGVLAAVRNSILLALVTCGVCIVVGTAAAYMKVRRNSKGAVTMEKCASLTYAIPGIVLSLAMIFHWVEPLPGIRPGVYGTIWILVIAYITRYLILQIKESLWQRQKSSLAAGIASYAGTSYFIRFLFDLCIITYRTYFVIYACKCRNKDHRTYYF